MNLKRLKCMDGGDPDRVVVAPCDPGENAQKWRCNKTINLFSGSKDLSFNRDNKLSLDDYGATWLNADKFCKTPIDYKGKRLCHFHLSFLPQLSQNCSFTRAHHLAS